MDLFGHAAARDIAQSSPLANRLRPRALDEFFGQRHIVGPGRLLRRAIQADQLSSLIFFGPPGTGKTTLAAIIANTTRSRFITINAVLSGIKEIRAAIAEAQRERSMHGRRTTLFVDEVHRWNKAQQDALLPHVENGLIILIGATTENPYFEVNKALVSRSRIFQLKPLTEDDIRAVVQAALEDEDRGYGAQLVQLADDALDHIVDVCNGDARTALNALELAVETTKPNAVGAVIVDLAVVEESIQRRAVLYDKEGDVHYDTISAFIKSLRGSDPDAALYWMAKMVYAGEDARYIFRRMAILASEDVGLADPQALGVVLSCWQAFERLGMPEGRFPLSQAALYLATCPKSNSAMAFFDALKAVSGEREGDVPNHLRDGSRDKAGFGHGDGYVYPHAYRDHWVAQQYLPTAYQGRAFYKPSDQGHEASVAASVARRKEAQLAAMLESEANPHREILTTAPTDRRREQWLQRVIGSAGARVAATRARIFETAALQRHAVVLDLRADTGVLTWEALRQAPEGGTWGLCASERGLQSMQQMSLQLPETERPQLLRGDYRDLAAAWQNSEAEEVRFDAIIGRDALPALDAPALQALTAVLAPTGTLCLHQHLVGENQRLWSLLRFEEQDLALRALAVDAEERLYAAAPGANWSAESLAAALSEAGFAVVQARVDEHHGKRLISASMLDRFFASEASAYAKALRGVGADEQQRARLERLFRRQLQDKETPWRSAAAWLVATLP